MPRSGLLLELAPRLTGERIRLPAGQVVLGTATVEYVLCSGGYRAGEFRRRDEGLEGNTADALPDRLQLRRLGEMAGPGPTSLGSPKQLDMLSSPTNRRLGRLSGVELSLGGPSIPAAGESR